MIRVGLSSNLAEPLNTCTVIKWDTVGTNNFNNDYNNYFSLLPNGYIQINNDNIKMVIATVSCQIMGATLDYLYINKAGYGRFGTQLFNGGGYTLTCCIPVSKGDQINAEIYPTGRDNCYINSWSDSTFFQITAI